MSTPFGALANTAVSLAKASKNPTLTNIVAIAPVAAQTATGNTSLNTNVTNGAALVGSAGRLLKNGSAFETVNAVNTAVRFAQGFLDPKTKATVGAITGGLNQIFGLGGLGFGLGGKPVALHTESLASQSMASAYSEGNDVVFSFVRADSNSAASGGSPFGDTGTDWNSGFSVDKAGLSPSLSGSSALKSQFSPLSVGSTPTTASYG
jgi:hypothetical protein